MRTRTILAVATLLAAGALLGWQVMPGPPVSSLRADEKADAELAKKVAKLVDEEEDRLVKFFKHLHANPELGFQETKTAALVAKELKELGYETHTGIGKTGVVGILKNGEGPVVLLRTELDALPVEEKTGLPYASTVRTKDDKGADVSVMHACGHDVHMASWLATARIMIATVSSTSVKPRC